MIGTQCCRWHGEDPFFVIAVGAIAGWLVSHFVKGIGFGILGDMIVAIGGACAGAWLLSEPSIHLRPEFLAVIIDATAGALLFLFVSGILRAAIERGASRGRHQWHRL